MTIFNGNRKIGNIYHGSRKIGKVYKGTELVYSSFNLIEALLAGDITLAEAKQQGLIDNYEIVTNCREAFRDDLSLVNVGYVDASQCTDLYGMYRECSNLESITYIDASSATSMNLIFYKCPSLTTAPVMDTSSATNIISMFNGCSSLTTAPVMDTSSATSMHLIFYKCSSLTEVTFTGNVVPPFGDNMFSGAGITTTTGTIYVPDNLYDQWITATNWVAYADIIKKESERP